MSQPPTRDVHIRESRPLPTPDEVIREFPATDPVNQTILESRQTIKRMIRGLDSRFLIIVGPCSIHDEHAAYEYAERLRSLQQQVEERFYLVMRVYFEKPRTVIGWKGLINDPFLDGSSDIAFGLRKAREILLRIVSMNVPTATELLDPVCPQYILDLITWSAIGARTSESQIHREMASGLSTPVGFKNNTEGNLQIAIDAIRSARSPHSFVGINHDGRMFIWKSTGNIWSHIILRGGREGANYDRAQIEQAAAAMKQAGIPEFIVVDCSHANSEKQYQKQVEVFNDLIQQTIEGNSALRGAMLESNLHEGSQPIPHDLTRLKYGVSVTDACIDWETTESLILDAYRRLG